MTGSGRKRRRRGEVLLHLAALLLSLDLSLALLGQTAFAKTYVITDGDRVVTYTTRQTDPVQVLGEAGLELGRWDTYTTRAVDGAEAITISRGGTVTIVYHGRELTANAAGQTVGELLERMGLPTSGEDRLSHGMEEPVREGMTLRVDRVVTVREVYTVTRPHATRYYGDESLSVGTEEVLIEGVDGEVTCTADVTYVNGEEVSRQVLSQKVTRAEVTEVVRQGTALTQKEETPKDMPVIADGYITLPTGETLTYTGTATIRATAYTHTDEGCDFTTATGTTVHVGTVAVDPRYIPYGTRMFIVSNDGAYVYGISVAEDCGGAIKGDRMDLYFPTYEECIQFGRRVCTIYFLG